MENTKFKRSFIQMITDHCSLFIVHCSLILFVLTFPAIPGLAQAPANIPLPDFPKDPGEYRFAAIGDSGTGGKNQLKLAEQILRIQKKTDFRLLLFLGDNIYENGSPKGIEKKFLKPYGSLIEQGVEVRGAIGNHDARSQNGVLLQKIIFNMGPRTYYSFSKENDLVEFFGLDSTLLAKEKKEAEGVKQTVWFENRIARSKAHWKITFLHHPLYSSAKRHGFEASDEKEMLRVREKLEPIFNKYKIQMSLHGHDHIYERTKPINGVRYFISGAGGKLRKNNLQKDSPFFAYGNDQMLSFMLFSIRRDSITFWSIGIDGGILDSGTISS
jgi:hypothetical protein